jgi:small GTP-binding protein
MIEEVPESKKIIIMGLDNAGKTSIVLSLEGKKNLLTYYSLSPTKDYNIVNLEILGSKYSIWDFGGQEIYLDDHLENLETYLEGTKKIIYVIDVQDIERYEKTLSFFEKILEKIKRGDNELDLSVFLHKFDPNLFSVHPRLSEEKIDDFIGKIESIINTDFSYKIFKTSIYTIFSKTPVY